MLTKINPIAGFPVDNLHPQETPWQMLLYVLVVISLGLAHRYLAGDSSDFCIYIFGAYFRLAHSDYGTFRMAIVIHIVRTQSCLDPRISENPSSDRLVETK